MTQSTTPPQDTFRTGFIAIVGRPNVGKSTLLNRLVGQKISIVSRKAQTTRHRITGIHTTEHAQFVFVDTPGFQTRHKNALNRVMNRIVVQTLQAVDVVLFVVECGRFGEADDDVLSLLPKDVPVILVINKLDQLADRAEALPFIASMQGKRDFAALVPVSAQKGDGESVLVEAIEALLPEGQPVYEADAITDRSERFLAAEFIREKLFRQLGDELPYGVAVEIEKFEVEGNFRRIHAAIIVDRAAHKGIVIGERGSRLKETATEARGEMEKLFDGKVFLEVWVKVKSGWADDERALRSLGYDEG
ncbi:MAG: putative GTP-binding protein [Pseudomonadota bacterium]|jgi:GTP-binding protein Era